MLKKYMNWLAQIYADKNKIFFDLKEIFKTRADSCAFQLSASQQGIEPFCRCNVLHQRMVRVSSPPPNWLMPKLPSAYSQDLHYAVLLSLQMWDSPW